MKKKFESEIRILIDDMGEFLKKMESFNSKVIYYYKFNDHIYLPKNPSSNWDPNRKTMRIREHLLPDKVSRILFTENDIISGKTFQFKQSKFPEGKIELYKGDKKSAEILLLSWDFQPHFTIKKTSGKLFEILRPLKFIVALEQIDQLGYSAEIELWGEDLTKIENTFLEIISLLDIPMENVTSNTLPYIVAEHLDLLKFD
ncbi:MAG: hypothetical protein HWN66_11260 [Candidatus Helarchaeota archaeon]|nr:hypothetical protein [Candidatus Helarchaeota archaeon]